jgi:hypothetical protein
MIPGQTMRVGPEAPNSSAGTHRRQTPRLFPPFFYCDEIRQASALLRRYLAWPTIATQARSASR